MHTPEDKAPGFLIRALRDPDGANLGRVQMIEGLLDADGKLRERIHGVALFDGREIGEDGRARGPVGNRVNLDKANYTNTIGDVYLAAHWTGPDFDPAELASYYVSCSRYQHRVGRRTTLPSYGIDRPDNLPATIKDRGYTSPVWYTP